MHCAIAAGQGAIGKSKRGNSRGCGRRHWQAQTGTGPAVSTGPAGKGATKPKQQSTGSRPPYTYCPSSQLVKLSQPSGAVHSARDGTWARAAFASLELGFGNARAPVLAPGSRTYSSWDLRSDCAHSTLDKCAQRDISSWGSPCPPSCLFATQKVSPCSLAPLRPRSRIPRARARGSQRPPFCPFLQPPTLAQIPRRRRRRRPPSSFPSPHLSPSLPLVFIFPILLRLPPSSELVITPSAGRDSTRLDCG